MGVSLQTHRFRIGTFNHGLASGSTKITKNETHNVNFKVVFFLLWVVNSGLVLTVIHNQCLPTKFSACKTQQSLSQLQQSQGRWLPSSSGSGLKSSSLYLPTSSGQIDFIYIYKSHISKKDRNFFARMVHGNRSQRGHGIKLVHWNKGPAFLINKHQEVETVLADHRPHVLGLSEANLKKDHDQSLVQHQDYNIHVCDTIDNPQLGISRVVVYCHRSLVVRRRKDLEDKTISAIWLEIGLPKQKKILHCQAYREWQHLGQADNLSGNIAAQLHRWEIFLAKWELALLEGKEVVVMMDANIDFLKWTRDDLPASDSTHKLRPLIIQLFSKIFPHGVSQLVSTATRTWPGQADSGLDHIYTNKPEKLSEVKCEYMGGSDHKLLKIVRFSKSLQRGARYVRKRCFKNFKNEEFIQAVKNISWIELYLCQDVNQATEILTTRLSKILDTMAPIRTVQIRARYAPWLSDDTKKLLKDRNAAQKVASETRDPDDWRYYKHLRNSATAKMKVEKKKWETNKLSNSEHDSHTLWKNVKCCLGWNNSGPPSQLFYNGKFVNTPVGLSSTMNKFFIEKVEGLRQRIPRGDTDPLTKIREVFSERNCTFKFKPVRPEEVMKLLCSLKNTKSSGVDYINTMTIKLIAKEILPAITHIINLSLTQGSFPSCWKYAKVIPLLKKGDPLSPKNYRPVALLPILSKILEKAVFNQIVEYLDREHLLHPNHHGSRAGHNTATALIQMHDHWTQEVDAGQMVGVMMIDLSAAFDMVDHPILLEKLRLFGLEEPVVQWFQSYLSGRSQSVLIDGCLSPPLDIYCGVPQGSILGPLLYIMFTNEIPDLAHNHPVAYKVPDNCSSSCGSSVCYVDDATYSVGHRDAGILSQKLTDQYSKIADYMAANNLVINAEKTHLVVMSAKNLSARVRDVKLKAGNHTILPSISEKLLGGHISQDLKWKQHILDSEDSLVRQLTSRINGLAIISFRATFQTRLMVANGIVMSKLCYLIQLWGGCDTYLIKPLQVLQNRAARLVTGHGWITPKRKLLKACRWLSIQQLVFYQSVVTAHKVVTRNSPLHLATRMTTDHPRRTRQATSGCIRFGETFSTNHTAAQKSFCHRVTTQYNSIPASIRSSSSITTFKSKLKKWVEINIPID